MNTKLKSPDDVFNEHRLQFQNRAVFQQIWRSCLSCSNWNNGVNADNYPNGYCDYYKATPPPKIIVHGCDQHEGDIPF